MSYCTKDEVRRRMFGGAGSGGSGTTTALPDAELDALIEQASRYFDLYCGVPAEYFEPADTPGVASDQTIYGQGTSYLKLPPYVPGSLDTLTVPTNYTAPTYIEKDGYLIITDSSGLTPFGQYRYPPYTVGWWEGVAITVSAVWGFEATPADVKMAVIELVINLERETDPASVKLKNLEGQALRESLPPRVREIAKRYRPQVGAAFA